MQGAGQIQLPQLITPPPTSWLRENMVMGALRTVDSVCLFLIFFNVYLFLRQRETEHEWGEGQRERDHRIGSRLQAVGTEPDTGLKLRSCEIMT